MAQPELGVTIAPAAGTTAAAIGVVTLAKQWLRDYGDAPFSSSIKALGDGSVEVTFTKLSDEILAFSASAGLPRHI